MKKIIFALIASMSLAGAAAAAPRHVSDLDYLNAKRCHGLAVGLGAAAEAGRLGAFVESEGRMRIAAVTDMGMDEYRRAKRQAADVAAQPRYRAELDQRCAGYMAGAETARR